MLIADDADEDTSFVTDSVRPLFEIPFGVVVAFAFWAIAIGGPFIAGTGLRLGIDMIAK